MLDTPLKTMKGIGERRAEMLSRQGLVLLRDILYYFPRTYLDYAECKSISALFDGDDAVVRVRIVSPPRVVHIRRGLSILTVGAQSAEGIKVELVWYNQPYRKSQIPQSGEVFACGRADKKRGFKLINPMLSSEIPGIIPVYPALKGFSQKLFRDIVSAALSVCRSGLKETLPEPLRREYALPELNFSLENMHFPKTMQDFTLARRRLAFEDMLIFRLMLALSRRSRNREKGIAFEVDSHKAAFIKKLPFPLTKAQSRVIDEIGADMAKPIPMNRLIQGDVGSGKTVLALFAMYAAVQNGFQAALMAPTELLAEQHYRTLRMIFKEKALLLTGGMKKKAREEAYALIRSGEPLAVVGTHALLQEGVMFSRLGVVIADEQHRFGVRQRAAISKKGISPDMLVMSATPIPRTLALIIYGDLDVSALDELPPGRKKVITRIVPYGKRGDMYRFIDDMAKKGKQTYIVCPLVSKSDALFEVLSATELYEELRTKLQSSVGLLHGQMDAGAKKETADAFRNGELMVLVSTTVIEVGVDVPNAAVMVVECADRFGLAQLHQLRGRVGRGREQSYCFLLNHSESETAAERLSILVQTEDGFEIAQKDLALRGPGEFLGSRQHGLSEFAAAKLAFDMNVLNDAREAANRLMRSPNAFYGAKTLFSEAKRRLREKSHIAPN